MKHSSIFNKHLLLLLLVSLTAWGGGMAVCLAHPAAKPFTLVIDAGHGGKDAGAVGTTTKEKTINLNVALAFGRMVERNCPDVKVVYTRKADVFVSLQERASIANKAKADLFISIHTNAVTSNKNSVCGAETYTLGMHRIAENLEVAKRENSVITYESNYKTQYQGFDPNKTESYIIFELLQDRYLSESIKLAKAIQQQYSGAGRRNKGVHQAGFLVLRETSMPSVLTELGFISNTAEEKFMQSQAGINTLAGCLYRGFQAYRKRLNTNTAENVADAGTPALLADNNLPPVYVAPGSEPSIRPIPVTPYPTAEGTFRENHAETAASGIGEREAAGQHGTTPPAPGNEKLPPLASTLNLPPEKEIPPYNERHEPATVEIVETQRENTPPALPEEAANDEDSRAQKKQPAQPAAPEIDPRTGQKLPPLASSLNLPPEKGAPPRQPAAERKEVAGITANTAGQPTASAEKKKATAGQAPTDPGKTPTANAPSNGKDAKGTARQRQDTPKAKDTPATPPQDAAATAQDEAGKAATADDSPVFKVQLLTSPKPLRDNDPRLKGLKAEYYKENGIYKYTYGATTDYQEIQRLKKSISKQFFGTFIVAFSNGKRTDLSEAIKKSKKK